MRNYTPGTIVYVDAGFVRHYGIVIDFNEIGSLTIISNSKNLGCVAEETIENFSGGRKIVNSGYPSNFSSSHLVARAQQQIGMPYKLFSENCEHFVRWVHHLKPESPQLQTFAMIVSVALFLMLATRN